MLGRQFTIIRLRSPSPPQVRRRISSQTPRVPPFFQVPMSAAVMLRIPPSEGDPRIRYCREGLPPTAPVQAAHSSLETPRQALRPRARQAGEIPFPVDPILPPTREQARPRIFQPVQTMQGSTTPRARPVQRTLPRHLPPIGPPRAKGAWRSQGRGEPHPLPPEESHPATAPPVPLRPVRPAD